MIRKLIYTFFIILSLNVAYSQSDTTHYLLGHTKLPGKPLFVIDGLRASSEQIAGLEFDKHCVKRMKTDAFYFYTDSVSSFFGCITIYTKLLIILNDRLLFGKNEKIETLSNEKREDIISINKIDKQEAFSKYGKKGKHGALIIKTNHLP